MVFTSQSSYCSPQMGYRCVVDTLSLQNFTLAGHSAGGAIAIRYMARHNGYGVSKLVPFENSGHGLFWEQRDKFNEELMKFIQG